MAKNAKSLTIATYNVNGIGARLHILLRWLREHAPDIACLQELKAPDERFPEAALHELGYEAVWHGQKSWNGVAILSRIGRPVLTRQGLPGDPDDSHSRYIEAAVGGVLIGCLYLPNGNPKPGPKFDYKLAWFERLIAHAAEMLATGLPVALVGDFNVMPTELDVYKPERWLDDALFSPEAREAYARLLAQGWTDSLRARSSGRAHLHLLGLLAERLRARCRSAHRPFAAEPRSGAPPAPRRRGARRQELGEDVGPCAGLDRAGRQMSEAAPLEPMEAKLVGELPEGEGWQFEPKWDGFRAIVRREGGAVGIWSKSGKPLGRYFPEMIAMISALKAERFLLDGELILPLGETLSFDALQARLHPAASRIAKLARETPAQLMLFDLLALDGDDYLDRPLAERRSALEHFHQRHGRADLLLSPCTLDRGKAEGWLAQSGAALDGVIAKRRDGPYLPGERAMLKVKQRRSADCVVGGVRYDDHGQAVASLLLGLYNEEGLLDHVGFVSGLGQAEKEALVATVAPLMGGVGFTGKAPGGPSRWNNGREAPWVPLAPELVVEVLYDQVTGNRFRHGVRLLRWRPDKAPRQCTFEQLAPPVVPAALGIEA